MVDNQMTKEEIEERIKLMKDNCVFCKIVKNEIPSKIIFEDDICMAILDINPATVGHILLLPKEHYMIMPQVPDEILGHIMVISKYLTDLIKTTFNECNDVTIFIANGAAAGQQSQHFMIHLIPRYENDNINFNLETKNNNLNEKELLDLAEKLKNKLNSFSS